MHSSNNTCILVLLPLHTFKLKFARSPFCRAMIGDLGSSQPEKINWTNQRKYMLLLRAENLAERFSEAHARPESVLLVLTRKVDSGHQNFYNVPI